MRRTALCYRNLRGALCLAALALTVQTMTVHAADLPQRGRFAEIFAEPPAARIVAARPGPSAIEGWLAGSPRVPGYYGRANDFHYNSYYGTSPLRIYSRLPYACPYFGYGHSC